MAAGRELTMLLLDDDEAICEIVETVANKAGFKPTVTQTATSFFRNMRLLNPDLIVLDLQLRDSDGIQMLRALADSDVTSAIALLSGMDRRTLSAAEKYAQARGLNLVSTIKKPFVPEDLLRVFLSVKSVCRPLGPEDLERGIENGELTCLYQPVASHVDRHWDIESAEALVRWEHPERGLLEPDAFLGLGESLRMSRILTDFVIRDGLEQVRGWYARQCRIGLRVNVSAALITDIEFPDRLQMALSELEVDGSALQLEVNETSMFADQPRSFDILTRLRLKGVGLTIDDFGIGISSLTQLFRMPFSEIKIDKSLIDCIDSSRETRVMVYALIDLAHKLDLKVCAEGVERREVLELLGSSGCDRAQGYFIARPAKASELSTLIRVWNESATSADVSGEDSALGPS